MMNPKDYTPHPRSIKFWSEEDRPREKMLLHGPKVLTTAELLAILISSGTAKISALDLAKNILASVDHKINKLWRKSTGDLMQFKGIGEAKAVTIQAALELGRRRKPENREKITVFNSSVKVFDYMSGRMKDLTHEEFWVLLLSRNLKLISARKISSGGMDSTIVDVRIIFRMALAEQASSMILLHNHPSGNPNPSGQDISLTKRLCDAGKLLDIQVLDHVIICDDSYYSFKDEGRAPL